MLICVLVCNSIKQGLYYIIDLFKIQAITLHYSSIKTSGPCWSLYCSSEERLKLFSSRQTKAYVCKVPSTATYKTLKLRSKMKNNEMLAKKGPTSTLEFNHFNICPLKHRISYSKPYSQLFADKDELLLYML